MAATEGRCEGFFYFDENMQMCRYPIYVDCKFDAVDVTCGSMDLELHPHPQNCDQYVACIEGFPRVINCAPNLHWNEASNQCDLPQNAQCRIAVNETDFYHFWSSVIKFFPFQPPEKELNYVCDPTRHYVTVHPHDCQSFIVCLGGERRINRCAKNLLFDPHHLHCDVAENVNCVQPPTNEPEVQYVCDYNRDFYFAPHPTNCQQYFICVFGSRRTEQCANELIFDWIHLRCDTRENGFCLAPHLA